MSKDNLINEIQIELSNIERLVNEIKNQINNLSINEPDLMIKTAIGTYLAQIYNGVENILKKLSKIHNINLPKSEHWQIDLFKRFCNPPYLSLPLIFDAYLEKDFTSLRKFRHVVFHWYAFQLNWSILKVGIENIETATNNSIKK